MLRLDRSVARLTVRDDPSDDGFVPGTPAERMAMVWDITVALWSVATHGRIPAHTRLRRDIAVLRRMK